MPEEIEQEDLDLTSFQEETGVTFDSTEDYDGSH